PVYRTVFEERAGKSLTKPDEFEVFNGGIAVYHDDIGDYASNEPTMDGTAGLAYYFAAMENAGKKQKSLAVVKDKYGAVIRLEPDKKDIYLVFTADSMFQGGVKILSTLKKERIKGSFFLTGNCLRMAEHADLIKDIIKQGHYVGGHSDKHLLYAPWEKRDSMLVSRSEIMEDLKANAQALAEFGVDFEGSRWFLPPYEYYNEECVDIIENMGYKVLNYTPGTATPADYTTPSMKNYQPSQKLIEKLYNFENALGLNGAILLIHPGVNEERTDRLYNRLGEIIQNLKKKGYTFRSLNEL
ncbi:MAG: polysaccharide deacetylase family protein, partial [Bacteroidales bacterium]|nr:polysaccharide deacetylase family protein [Bacteroidales bacterium]